jgi:uncharacterized protein (PEP-CTERM system associated)
VGTIETRYTFQQGTTLSLSGNAGYDQASYDAENLGFNQFYRISGRMDHPLNRWLNVYIAAAYWWNNYTNEDPDREDTVVRPEVGLRYQALPWMMVEVNYMFQELDSNMDENDYKENRAGFFVTFTPQQPVLLSH